ncbi:MAG: acetate/propionate family kinase [Acidimicrobiales bacterium]|nr:acetate/propionate family kinase [Acidimicrobiales bacterium]
MRILVVNAGSSSLKLRVLDEHDDVTSAIDLPASHGRFDRAALGDAVAGLEGIDVVGHRVVHGGTEFTGPVRIDGEVVARLDGLSDLAPLHQPVSLAALDAASAPLPGVAAVACFDTAFHATLPPAAATYALPAEWRRRFGLRRYGFHGLSHAYASRRAAAMVDRPVETLRIVTCHLGAGASLAAVHSGRSVDTTMGFTPLEGLVMATRAGSLDPGLVLWLEEHVGTPAAELAATFEHRSGLFGLAGTADMREVLAGSTAGDPDARLALEVYVHRLRAGIAAMAAAMGGMDALVFTGGVGERSPDVRKLAVSGLGFLGVELDEAANERGEADRTIHAADSGIPVLVVAAREDLEIAAETRRGSPPTSSRRRRRARRRQPDRDARGLGIHRRHRVAGGFGDVGVGSFPQGESVAGADVAEQGAAHPEGDDCYRCRTERDELRGFHPEVHLRHRRATGPGRHPPPGHARAQLRAPQAGARLGRR